MKKLNAILQMGNDLVDEETVIVILHNMKKEMEQLCLCDEAIESVLKFIGREIQNRQYSK